MKKLLSIICLLIVIISCDRKPLYLQEQVGINISITAYASIDSLWKKNWRDSLIYNWDESKYGPIGYTTPERVSTYLISDIIEEQPDFIINEQQNVYYIDMHTYYKLLLYNKTSTTETKNANTSTYNIHSIHKEGSTKETQTEEPGEIFESYIPDLYITEENISREGYINGVYTYIYDLDMVLHPVTYIYIIQFVVKDNLSNPEILSINNFSITGLSNGCELYKNEREPYNNTIITVSDIKERQTKGSRHIYASRFTTFGPVDSQSDGSWGSDKPSNNIYINITSKSKGNINILMNLTKKFEAKPNGGIITLFFDASKISDLVDDGWWIVDISEWADKIYDIPI